MYRICLRQGKYMLFFFHNDRNTFQNQIAKLKNGISHAHLVNPPCSAAFTQAVMATFQNISKPDMLSF